MGAIIVSDSEGLSEGEKVSLQPITIDGRVGTIVYLNSDWKPVEADRATLAKVLFDDGGSTFYQVAQNRSAFDPDQPRDEGGKWTDSGTGSTATVEKKTKAPKAPPVSMELKKKAYEMVKSGTTFKATAKELGMTPGQVAGHIWKVDQKKKALEEKLVEKPVEVVSQPFGSYQAYGKVYSQYGVEIGNIDKNAPGGWTAHSTEKLKADIEASHGPAPTISEHPAGYEWKEKTTGPQAGKYAYFQHGVQVSSAFKKEESSQAVGTIHQGQGPGKLVPPTGWDVTSTVEKGKGTVGDWPIGNDVERKIGDNYWEVLEKVGSKWADGLSEQEKNTIKSYTGSSYTEINNALRGKGAMTTYYKKQIDTIEEAINKASTPPPPELVWRGASSEDAQKFVAQLASGDVIKLAGFQSTSIKPEFANNWSNNKTVFEIKPAKGAYISPISMHKSEYEYLLPHGAKYTVRGIAKVKLGYHGENTVIQLEMHK